MQSQTETTPLPKQHAIVIGLCLRRRFWQVAYPFARLANKWFGASYKWVNVGIGAWHPELFDGLWHHRWYGQELTTLPESVNLNGIRYETTVSEGLVMFTNRDFGTAKLCFTRDPHDVHGVLWYYEGSAVPASHVETAYNWVKAVYGGSFEKKRLPLSR